MHLKKLSNICAGYSQYTAMWNSHLAKMPILGAVLAALKSSTYEDLGVKALLNSLVAVSTWFSRALRRARVRWLFHMAYDLDKRKDTNMENNMVNVYFFGKKYSVPGDLTIMTAMEYAGYTLKRGCGCRHGFCGACATIYRIKGQNELKTCLACQTQVQEGMYVASIPFFPTDKRLYNIEDLKPNQQVMMELYPEIYSCIGCNACTKACTQDLNVMQYIAYAQRGELEKCAEESFDCVSCGCCSVRCPAGISHPMVGLLARRLTGKYIAPKSEHLEKRVEEIHEGKFDDMIEKIMQKPITEMQELYNSREIEK